MSNYFLPFLLSLGIMLYVTPKLTKLAHKINYTEKPNKDSQRKIHTESKAYLAAVGILFTFWSCYFLFTRDFSTKALAVFGSSFLIWGIGMADDWFKINGRDLKALPKFVFQLLACIMAVYFTNIKFAGITNPFNDAYIMFPLWFQYVLSVLWLFGVTTVINFSDGLDGLAGGISCISAGTLFIVSIVKGNHLLGIMSIALVGVCLGYLRYNRYPAKILMGDAGATFLGFMLAVISLDGAFKQATAVSIFIPILALGLPIFDNIFVVLKRLREGKKVYVGDASQIHYRLLAKGLTQKQAVYFLYLVCICLNLSAIILLLLGAGRY
ncbi:putative undecaprenyl-phosphate N-acetylglucosaminyl 1-phosphate transferase [Ruminiclostridium hungatei]|uniref:Putative undecaprenyl-phosphate N-acetylglucosaminyl 1-phosphate transferase n=1 Tax=Ruminiclostridium hungatei TaxID=48256 RepID=A0A1V4SEI5_RUMHU|nr:MraY family glycosyltransferase [Ruminiclostridium hungatei]OPX42234.1 putative undecaprenyl-phosphate N-acetylglucosaminyl 1-phosphate transferase [Ruminiclostridium hungatei]